MHNIPLPKEIPLRTFWYMKMFGYYIHYEKFPWEVGYPAYEEIHNIFPFMLREWNNEKSKREEIARDYENQKKGTGYN